MSQTKTGWKICVCALILFTPVSLFLSVCLEKWNSQTRIGFFQMSILRQKLSRKHEPRCPGHYPQNQICFPGKSSCYRYYNSWCYRYCWICLREPCKLVTLSAQGSTACNDYTLVTQTTYFLPTPQRRPFQPTARETCYLGLPPAAHLQTHLCHLYLHTHTKWEESMI